MKTFLFSLPLILAAGCEQGPSQPSTPRAVQDIVGSTIFVRHPTVPDLCLGYLYVEQGFSDGRTGGPAVFAVDCAKVEPYLVNK
jgi:hypothetical protein